MTSTRALAVKILAAAVLPERIDLVEDAERLTRPFVYSSRRDGRDDDATVDYYSDLLNADSNVRAFLPIPIEHPVYDDFLPRYAGELVEVGHVVLGIDRANGRVLVRREFGHLLTVRLFWIHGELPA